MALTLSISMGGKQAGSLRIQNFDRRKRENLKRGLLNAGAILETKIKKNLSGPSHTRNPGNANPFPGVLNNTLRPSVRHKVRDLELRVGPGSESRAYAAIHEFGGVTGRGGATRIPKRAYVKPAWEEKRKEAFRIIRKWLFKPLR